MIQTGFETRVKVQQIIQNQLPEFILDESPKTVDFLKQYYISQEYQGGTVDIAENLDQYLKVDNLTPEVVVGVTTLSSSIQSQDTIITVSSTKGFPNQYGLLKIDDEIITYTQKTSTSFTGCIRGFSGITSYHDSQNPEELVFSTSTAASHTSQSPVQNLSSLFLKEFYKKLKFSLTPGLEDVDFVPNLHVGNFVKQAKYFYQAKGTEESFRILFNVLYGITPKLINLETLLLKPSSAEFIRREVVIAERISGNPYNLIGQTIVKSTDENTSAPVSEVEILTRNNKSYYKISLFVGYEDRSLIQGTFNITPNTKSLETTSIGSSVISVDSTIGFAQTGTLISGSNIISYTDKSINQFLGCSGISSEISTTDSIRNDEIYYGYENGDPNKKVELRLTGVLSDFIPLSDNFEVSEGDEISVKNIGTIIKNSNTNNRKEILSNSWIYNTSSRYQIKSFNLPSLTLSSAIDKSSLKQGDYVELLERDTQNVVLSATKVDAISQDGSNTVTLNNFNGFVYNSSIKYDLRRKINKASSTGVPIQFGNNKLISDVQNVYDDEENSLYVASNGLPSYTITKTLTSASISNALPPTLQGDFDSSTQTYSTISFSISQVPFVTGDKVYYKPQGSSLPGLQEGSYYVEVLSSKNKIKLYSSKSLIGIANTVGIGTTTSSDVHTFILDDQKSGLIYPQKLFKKFPINLSNENIQNGLGQTTNPGTTGMLINGVEIENYKSENKIYYGPLDSISILNGGDNYDVINPPLLTISSSSGTTALVQPVVRGDLKKIFIDPQDFDISNIVSIALTGGNGSGAVFEPVIQKRRREVIFDAREIKDSGGISTTSETITFLTNHNFVGGEPIIYDSNNNLEIGTSPYYTYNSTETLKTGNIYYASIINSTTIQLYPSLPDYRLGINTVGFTSLNTTGFHKFKTSSIKNVLSEIKVIDGGSGYENRKLIVNPSGISTTENSINFNNHGFNDGDLIDYSYQTSTISGLSSSHQYYVLKINENSFKLSDAGVGGTNKSYYQRRKYENLTTQGSGYQYFSYPNISLSIQYSAVGVGTTTLSVGILTATPVIRGKIVDTYLYESGSDYGSTILNLHKRPLVTIKNGKESQFKPIIIDGKITEVQVLYGGLEYYSTPDLIVYGDGIGAELRPIVYNNRILKVIVINSGAGYSVNKTSVVCSPAGSGAILQPFVRSLTVNNNFKYGDEVLFDRNGELEYSICGYFNNLKNYFGDDGTSHSNIIGWAYDGNPIYGSYGYSDPSDINSSVKYLTPGYSASLSNITNRPLTFPNGNSIDSGFFVEDYIFDDSGDLDEHNGRFGKTKDFPNGTYAYFATIAPNQNSYISKFPYFIGDTYRSNFVSDNNSINQTFDFLNSNLVRNTFPYKMSDPYAGNDFIIESNESIDQKAVVESVMTGSIESFDIVESGDNYKINDLLTFDENGTGSNGLSVSVSEINGKDILNLNTSVTTYENTVLTWENGEQLRVSIQPYHNLSDGDIVSISGVSTNLSNLNGIYSIKVSSDQSFLSQNVASNALVGFVTDIFLSNIPSNISIGSSISIEDETMKILNIFNENNALKVVRNIGSAHSSTTQVNFIPDNFLIDKKTTYFESKLNDTVYFNPIYSIGYGVSAGVSTSVIVSFAANSFVRSIPSQSIYLKNHPFTDNQKVIFTSPISSPLSVSTSFNSSSFDLFSSGNSQIIYVTNKSNNTIGIKTQLNSSELFFVSNGSDRYDYSIQSVYHQETVEVDKIKTTVSITTSHGLSNGDVITLTTNPNLSVGIGTSISVYVQYEPTTKRILINPASINSLAIDINSNSININSHDFKTGDKVYYTSSDSVASGLSTGFYFVYKVDNNNIKLSNTYIDCISTPLKFVDINSQGGNGQKLSKINPQLNVVRNNDLLFNVSDSSLSGYKFKLFFDNDFNNEFVSLGSTSSFIVSGVGTVGISTNATVTIKYNSDLPTSLYYSLEKSGNIIASDNEVFDASKISFVNSQYSGTYSISGVGTTTFDICLSSVPEKLNYSQFECDELKFTTTSTTASGGISKVRILFSNNTYKKIPTFTGSNSINGSGAYLIPKSYNMGRSKEIKILNEGYEYSSDKTLRPAAYVSPVISLESSNKISKIDVLYGGKNYNFAPKLIVINSNTGEEIDNGFVEAVLTSNNITSVNIIQPPKGLPASNVELRTINNSNGISINTVETSISGLITCYLSPPSLGFTTSPFSVGDQIYVEGIQQYSSDGSGFNSDNYGYQFFTVSSYDNVLSKLSYSVSGLTTNAGIAKTIQNNFANIVKYEDYPKFKITEIPSEFLVGEGLLVNSGNGFNQIDLIITSYDNSFIKVFGSYDLSVGEIIKGKTTGTIATINRIETNNGRFSVSYSLRQDYGWLDNIGKLDEDSQVIANNDYYQNLSYSIKSPIEFEKFIGPVNNLLHTSGLKNFADTQIVSNSRSVGIGSTDASIIVFDITEEKRVDTINNFDLAFDSNVVLDTSKFLRLRNKKLAGYLECQTNRVLRIDDIQSQFSNGNADPSDYLELVNFSANESYNRYLIQISNTQKTQYQINEVVVLNTENDTFTLQKGSIFNQDEKLGDIYGYTDIFGNSTLRFAPTDPYSYDYDVKVLNYKFISSLAGISTQYLGYVNLISSNSVVQPGITTSIVSLQSSNFSSVHSSIELVNNATNEINYVEIYLNHDGTNTYLSEYYFDANSSNNTLSYNFIGTFGSSISGGVVQLNYTNTASNQVTLRSRNVGFGTTSVGIATYRFKVTNQIDGYERTAFYQSNYSNVSSASTIISLDTTICSGVKSIVKVGIGLSSALHQVVLVQDASNLYVEQYPFLSIGSTNGIGTFGGEYSGSNFVLKFYPNASITGNVEIISYNEVLYSDSDYVNTPQVLSYGAISESYSISKFYGINGSGINKLNFNMNYNETPIFMKTFDPTNSSILDPVTGIFTIKDHFFNDGEELIYTPNTTFLGVGISSVGIGSSTLPTKVFAHKITKDTFKLALTKNFAISGICVTFTSYGQGNSHQLEMAKKNEKSIITIDGIVQYPISFTPINYNLINNGVIGIGRTILSLSGITSIYPNDILKVDNEYMKISNVGLGTTSIGPVQSTGSYNLVEVERGYIGSAITTHTDSTNARIYRGSFNIVGNQIYFTQAPYGNPQNAKTTGNLEFPKSSFTGRVFLRQDYTTNIIYDDISNQFTGIGQTYRLTTQGINTVGLGTSGGNGIVFINNFFQSPSTFNNTSNNFSIIEDSNSGITSIVFTGIRTSSDYPPVQSVSDVNRNQLPRGGLIISLGSTPGLGYAPLVGASVTAVVSGGSIVSVGIGTTDILGSGYYGTVSVGVTDVSGSGANITATVGVGGTLRFNVIGGGSGYSSNPRIQIAPPSYENMPIIGVSRLGIGTTTATGVGLLMNVEVGSSSTTGIGSTLFQVKSFKITRSGYGFNRGDVFTPVGLVTAKGLSSPLEQFQVTVLDVFNDSFSAWQFGELNYIDSLKNYQDGIRKRFPLYYNNSLLSIESGAGSEIDLSSILLIFINGVIQDPGVSYQFDGGTSFTFTDAPKIEDNISVFFYAGTKGVDSKQTSVTPSLKTGDIVQVIRNNDITSTISQNPRTVFNITSSDTFETNLYLDQGIDTENPKPLYWTKQKVDQTINGEEVYKSRDSLEPLVYPAARIIKDFSSTDTEIFVDDAQFFNYENLVSPNFNALIIDSGDSDPVSAAVTAVVSAAGTIQSLSINNPGSGYTGASVTVKISAPFTVGVSTSLPMGVGIGIGSTATATIAVSSSGSLTTPITITNPGLGYSIKMPPQVIVPLPSISNESIYGVIGVNGKSGIITGISTSSGIGTSLGLKFNLNSVVGLATGYPIYIYNTTVGTGVTSIDTNNDTKVGIGTTFLDNIYKIHSIDLVTGIVTCNIDSRTSIVGLSTNGLNVGSFSWGRLSGFSRDSNPISIAVSYKTINSGLTTFPTIQRRGYGLRNTGGITK
jgi:hypothetical protein